MTKKEFSFNQAVDEIEKILQKIEEGAMDVDRLSSEVKRASDLIKQCQKKLKSTEEEIVEKFPQTEYNPSNPKVTTFMIITCKNRNCYINYVFFLNKIIFFYQQVTFQPQEHP